MLFKKKRNRIIPKTIKLEVSQEVAKMIIDSVGTTDEKEVTKLLRTGQWICPRVINPEESGLCKTIYILLKIKEAQQTTNLQRLRELYLRVHL